MDAGNELQGLSVLVTRPQHQANTLCQHLEHNGAVVVPFPTIEIQATKLDKKEVLSTVPRLVIWTSPNAALHSPEWLINFLLSQEGCRYVAIGGATQKVLQALGFRSTEAPPKGATSETLLTWLDQGALKYQEVMLVKGQGGRDVLAQGLEKKGARVVSFEVYRRTRATVPDVLMKITSWLDAQTPVSLFTSVEAFENLLAIVPTVYHGRILAHPMVCASARIKKYAESKGATNTVLSKSTHDDDMVAALFGLFESCV